LQLRYRKRRKGASVCSKKPDFPFSFFIAFTVKIYIASAALAHTRMPDYFEIDRLVEDLAKIYSTACATSWFKITGNKRPTREEFRVKVVEFMKHFEYTLSAFPNTPEGGKFSEHAKKLLENEIAQVLAGENKEVEKRYKYYVDYS
jgi:hypothetical protein